MTAIVIIRSLCEKRNMYVYLVMSRTAFLLLMLFVVSDSD